MRVFDPAAYLDTREGVLAYLEEALGVVARALGMTRVAQEAGLSRESLYPTLGSEGNPELATLLRVLGVLGVRLSVKAVG